MVLGVPIFKHFRVAISIQLYLIHLSKAMASLDRYASLH